MKYSSRRQQSAVYRVTACPKYVPGDLPKMAETEHAPRKFLNIKMAGYDVTCPHCGNASGNGVAGTTGLKPEEWYCRCTSCNKSFRPRKKEVEKLEPVNETAENVNENADLCNENTESYTNNADSYNAEPGGVQQDPFEKQPEKPKTRLEIARGKITPEEYMRARDLGENNKQIYESLIIAPDTFYRLLEEWGLKGYQPKQDDPRVEAKTEKAPESRTISEAITLHDELEEELESLDWLLDPERNIPLVKSVRLLLDDRRCHTAMRLTQILDAFNTVTVNI